MKKSTNIWSEVSTWPTESQPRSWSRARRKKWGGTLDSGKEMKVFWSMRARIKKEIVESEHLFWIQLFMVGVFKWNTRASYHVVQNKHKIFNRNCLRNCCCCCCCFNFDGFFVRLGRLFKLLFLFFVLLDLTNYLHAYTQREANGWKTGWRGI